MSNISTTQRLSSFVNIQLFQLGAGSKILWTLSKCPRRLCVPQLLKKNSKCETGYSQVFKDQVRVAKCHGYDRYIRDMILLSWGKKKGELGNHQKSLFQDCQVPLPRCSSPSQSTRQSLWPTVLWAFSLQWFPWTMSWKGHFECHYYDSLDM